MLKQDAVRTKAGYQTALAVVLEAHHLHLPRLPGRGGFSLFTAAFDDLSPAVYEENYTKDLPRDGVELQFATAAGKQVAFYFRAEKRGAFAQRLWVAFGGNASLALDWTRLLDTIGNPAMRFC